eukprot:15068329-Alexandrium_andersonii.AAC.1
MCIRDRLHGPRNGPNMSTLQGLAHRVRRNLVLNPMVQSLSCMDPGTASTCPRCKASSAGFGAILC